MTMYANIYIYYIQEWFLLNITLNDILYPSMTPRGARTFSYSNADEESSMLLPLVLSSLHKDTIIHEGGESPGGPQGDCRISYCSDSYIYILKPSRIVYILGCMNCTIVLGPTMKSVTLDLCENVKLVSFCRKLVVINSVDCTLYVHTPYSPLLLGDFRGLVFAPHNCNYSLLEEHIRKAKMTSEVSNSRKHQNVYVFSINLFVVSFF